MYKLICICFFSILKVLLRVRAEHKYDEERPDEISIMPGDIIKDVKKEQRDWWRGVHEKTGKEGQLRSHRVLSRSKTICTDKLTIQENTPVKSFTSFREKLMRKISLKRRKIPRESNYVTRDDISHPLTEPERITADQFPSLFLESLKTNK